MPSNLRNNALHDLGFGIATRYGLDGPVVESRWGAIFSAPVHTGPGAQPPIHWVRGLSWGYSGRAWRRPPTLIAPRLKKE